MLKSFITLFILSAVFISCQNNDSKIEELEKFEGYSEPNDDNSKIYAVKFDRCKYYSIWQIDKGEIQLSIDHNSSTDCYIKLLYLDKINGDKIKAKAKGDL